MVQHGVAPFLECSSKGDKRFSEFFARVQKREGRSIEDLYQASKRFANGSTNLSWRDAKGRKAINMNYCSRHYSRLWAEYVEENPELLTVLVNATGLSDIFGQPGHVCQATVLWDIRAKQLKTMEKEGAF